MLPGICIAWSICIFSAWQTNLRIPASGVQRREFQAGQQPKLSFGNAYTALRSGRGQMDASWKTKAMLYKEQESSGMELEPLSPSTPLNEMDINSAPTDFRNDRNTTNPSRAEVIPDKSLEAKQDAAKSKDKENNSPDFPLESILSQTMDTLEDAYTHARRLPYDWGLLDDQKPSRLYRPTVVVLGSGWAAHAFFKIIDTFQWRVVVVSPANHFVFTPMLASASVGTVEYRSMTEAVRAANPMIEQYIEGKAIDLDVQKRIVTVQLNSLLEGLRAGPPPVVELPYDRLVVAVGCKVADNLVPGAAEYCLRLKSCDDARRLRTAIGECLEYASRPDVTEFPTFSAPSQILSPEELELRRQERIRRVTFAVVGGGPTGVELAGELADFVRDISRPRVGSYPRLRDDIRIILIQGGSELVPQFDPALREHALQSLRKAGVDVRLSTSVNEVGDGFIKLSPKGSKAEAAEIVKVGLTIWAAGTAPVPFVSTLLDKLPPQAKASGGKVAVDEWLRCPTPTKESFGSILVMGDASSFAETDNSYLPQTAQVAGQQGAYAARLLCRGYDLSVTPPILSDDVKLTCVNTTAALKLWLQVRGLAEAQGFDFLNLGLLAYVGGGEALSQIQIGDVPIMSYAGSISFVLWRSVYLVKQVATRNRVLVTFDWIKSAIFGRDVTRL